MQAKKNVEHAQHQRPRLAPFSSELLERDADVLPGLVDCCSWEELGQLRTIINLRVAEDNMRQFECYGSSPPDGNVQWVHLPVPNQIDKYDLGLPEVREWLASALHLFEEAPTSAEGCGLLFPMLVHCFAGKDRTGVVIATLLLALGVDEETVVREFLLCGEGTDEADLCRTICSFTAKACNLEHDFRKGVCFNRIRATFARAATDANAAEPNVSS